MGVRSGQDAVAVGLGVGHGQSAYPDPVKATQPLGVTDALRASRETPIDWIGNWLICPDSELPQQTEVITWFD